MDLSEFTVFDFNEGVPYFSATRNGLTFSKAVAMKLGFPEYARFLYNSATKQVVLQACAADTPRATVFFRPKKSGALSVRWSSRDLISTLERLLDVSLETHGFRVEGELIDDRTMLFDLTYAHPLD